MVINHHQHINATEPGTQKAQVTTEQFSAPDKKVFRRVRRNPTYLIAYLTISSLKEALKGLSLRKQTQIWLKRARAIVSA